MQGNLSVFLATLWIEPWRTSEKDYLKLAESLTKALKLSPCGFVTKKYPGGFTIVQFLKESHIILTTYFENGVVELELASCKRVSETEFAYAIAKIKKDWWGVISWSGFHKLHPAHLGYSSTTRNLL